MKKTTKHLNTTTTVTLLIVIFTFLVILVENASAGADSNAPPKVLFVVSSHEYGYWASELLQPWLMLKEAGVEVEIASPRGGKNPVSGLQMLSNTLHKKFYSPELQEALEYTIPLRTVDPEEFAAVYVVGGSGPMFDLVNDVNAQRIIKEIYEDNGVVAADCHGPAALVNVRLSDGTSLVEGKRLTAKSNSEEGEGASDFYPFLLEDKFKQLGAIYSSGTDWTSHVVVDGNLVTGQNPQSAVQMTNQIIKILRQRN